MRSLCAPSVVYKGRHLRTPGYMFRPSAGTADRRGDVGVILKGGLVDTGDGEFERVDVVVEDGRITGVGSDAAGAGAEGEVIDCGRLAVVPGMVNAHCHSNENWFRGRWDNLPLEPWMLFSYPALAGPVQSSRETYLRTLIGGLEMVHSGATCVVDFL